MIQSKKDDLDQALNDLLARINEGTVTCEDLNGLIHKVLIMETTPESARDRVRRRTIRNATSSHQEVETGHQPLKDPHLNDRVVPRRAPQHQQGHGRGELGHRHSTRAQAGVSRYQPALEFLQKYKGKSVTEEMINQAPPYLRVLIARLISSPNIDRDWLYSLLQRLP